MDPAEKTLLIVDDDAPFRTRLVRAMESRDFKVFAAETVEGAIAIARTEKPNYAVVDLRIGPGNGLDVVTALREAKPDSRVVMLTGYGNIATAVAAVGAAPGQELLAPEGGRAVAALAGERVDARLVEEFHPATPARRRARPAR